MSSKNKVITWYHFLTYYEKMAIDKTVFEDIGSAYGIQIQQNH